MTAPEQQEMEEFSLSRGGLLYTLSQRAGLAGRTVVRALVLTALAWIPPLILSAIGGLAAGDSVKIPFLRDYGVYGRILVAIPVLLIAEIPIDIRTRHVLGQFLRQKLVREQDVPQMLSDIHHAVRLRDSALAEILILLIIYSGVWPRVEAIRNDVLSIWYYTHGKIAPAGWYSMLVSLPIFQFLLLRWLWRLMIWTELLWRISRLDLQLVPIHPDRMGGLGFLGLAQVPFGLIGFAGGTVISSYLVNNVVYRGVSLTTSTSIMFVYIVLAVVVIIAPILVFTGRLVDLRANGILAYGCVGEDYAESFDRKWVGGLHPEDEKILGSSDVQSLADIANSLDVVRNMKVIPVDRLTISVIAGLAAVPMISVFFVALPFDKIVAKIIGILG